MVRGDDHLRPHAWGAGPQPAVFGIILAIEVPLGIFIALNMPKGWGRASAWC
jgi:hypothetical protein